MSSKNIYYAVGAVVVIVLIVGAAVMMRSPGSNTSNVFNPDADKYYAVFLKSDQVYFGKIGDRDGQYLQLENVYYLSMTERLQPLAKEDEEGAAATGPKFTLIKLGRELHDPADEMFIRQDEITFIEPLRDDSRVIQAIEKAKAESIQN